MKRPRFTLRASMVAVAVTALVLWGHALWRRSVAFDARAQECESTAEKGILLPRSSGLSHNDAEIEMFKRYHEWDKRFKEHYSRLALKYRRAARFPWMPIDPDPREPAGPIDSDPSP